MDAFSSEPATDLRAVERGGVEPAIRRPEERRSTASEVGGSGAGEAAVGIPAIAVEAGGAGSAREPQARVSGVPGSGTADPAKKKKTHAANGFCEADGDGSEPGVGFGFCARCGGEREEISRVECDRCVHAGMPGAGSGNEFCEPARDPGAGEDCGGARSAG